VSSVDELIEDFADLDEHDAVQVLDEIGRELPRGADSLYQDDKLVPGCQSRVWMELSFSDATPPRLEMKADSDAIVVKGLVYVVLQIFEGLTAEEVLDVDYSKIFDAMGLGRLITPQRKNGLHAMVQTVRNFAGAVAGIEPTAPERPRPTSEPPAVRRSLDHIVDEFPILKRPLPSGLRPVFLDSGASAQKPKVVIEQEREVEEQYYANAFRGKYYFGQRVDDGIEGTRDRVAAFVGAKRSEEIVFTPGTTASINLVAFGWAAKHLKPGDEIVITELEHHANFVPWQVVAQRTGAQLKIVPVNDQGELDTQAMQATIGPNTKLVAICSMSNVTGAINPVRNICEWAHQQGAVVLVDAAQSVPHSATDVSTDEIDFLAFSGHKLYGPSGVGVLYGRHELLDELDPVNYGGHMIETVGRERSTYAAPPAKFEAGTPPIVPIIGLGAAVEFVQSIGFEAIEQRERELITAAHRGLNRIEGLTLHGPPAERKGAIASFSIAGVSTEDLAFRLDQHGIFTRHGHHCAMVLHERLGVAATTRASFGLYNTTEDVDALCTAVEKAVDDILG